MELKLSWHLQHILLILLLIGLMLPFYMGLIIFLVILAILFFSHMLSDSLLPEQPLETILWLFIFYSFVIAIINLNAAGVLVSLAVLVAMIFFNYYTKNVRPSFLETLIDFLVGASMLLSVFAILEYLKVIPQWNYTFISEALARTWSNRSEATFFNPNYYAMMLEFFLTAIIYRFVESKNTKHKLAYLLIGSLNVIAVLLTGSRTPFMVIPVVMFIFLYITGYKKQAIGGVGAIALLLVIAGILGYLPRIDSIEWALADRISIWTNALRGIRDNFWFGQGFMPYMHLSTYYGYPFKPHSHNLYLEILLSFGVIGSSLFAMPVVHMTRLINALRAYPTLRPLLALYCSMIACVLVHGIMDVPILWFQTGFVFLFVILTAPNVYRYASTHQLGDDLYPLRHLDE